MDVIINAYKHFILEHWPIIRMGSEKIEKVGSGDHKIDEYFKEVSYKQEQKIY